MARVQAILQKYRPCVTDDGTVCIMKAIMLMGLNKIYIFCFSKPPPPSPFPLPPVPFGDYKSANLQRLKVRLIYSLHGFIMTLCRTSDFKLF